MASQLASTHQASLGETLLRKGRSVFGSTARKGLLGLADQVVVSGTSFLTTVIIGRYCGPDQLGVYSLGFTLLVFIAVLQESLISAPYTVYASRFGAARGARYAGSVLGHYVVLAMMAAIALAIGALVVDDALQPILWLLAAIVPFTLLREFGRRTCFAHLQMGRAIAIDLAVAVVQVSLLAALIWTDRLSPWTAYLAIGFATGVASVAWLVTMRKHLVMRLRWVKREWRRSWRFGRWVMAAQTTAVVDMYLIFWIVAGLIDAAATGILAACLTLIQLANPVVLGVSNVFEPRAAHAYHTDGRAELRRITRKVTLLMVATMAGFGAVIGVLGNWIMQLIYGESFGGHHLTTMLIAGSFMLSAITAPAGDSLRVIEKPKVNFFATAAGLIVGAVLIAVWAKPWGLEGAAWGYCIGTAVCSAIQGAAYLRYVCRKA